jgi:ABC-type nitrate/sulfonate/bicarbonate transport system ATPase subunit
LINQISFGYPNAVNTLNELTFQVLPGKTLCILGASGSGKSTLLKIIADLITPHSGHIAFNNQPIEELKRQGRLSFMFQDPCLMPNLTVQQNVEFPSKMLGRTFVTTFLDTIRMVGLQQSVNKLPNELSGGMRTRTALARSFISQPSLLLLDEAFTGLDQGWRYDLYQELKTLQQRDNTTIVMVTHDIDEALELADEICFLDCAGQLRFSIANAIAIDERSMIRTKLKTIIKEDHLKQLQLHA